MWKQLCLIATALTIIAVNHIHALDPSALTGTMEVQFHPMQMAGIKQGCTLVYRTIGQDFAYRQGKLIALSGNIAYVISNQGVPGLGLKIATINILDEHAKPEPPNFAYIETPNGTTAKSKFLHIDSPDTPGARYFSFQLDESALKVMGDIATGSKVTIGFNREKGGLDVLVPLDLSVIESTAAENPLGFNRRHSDETLHQFRSCVLEVSELGSELGKERLKSK